MERVNKFKVGDKVKVIKRTSNGPDIGSIGEVLEKSNIPYCKFNLRGYSTWAIHEGNLELYKEPQLQYEPKDVAFKKYWNILENCTEIAKERETQYGDSNKNFTDTLDILNAISDKEYTMQDIRQVMFAIKLARLKKDPNHEDSQLDLINYIAIFKNIKNED